LPEPKQPEPTMGPYEGYLPENMAELAKSVTCALCDGVGHLQKACRANSVTRGVNRYLAEQKAEEEKLRRQAFERENAALWKQTDEWLALRKHQSEKVRRGMDFGRVGVRRRDDHRT
jgi:hypothetical protein